MTSSAPAETDALGDPSEPNLETDLLADVPMERRPKHIAVIMDGNGRWARRQNLPRIEGHRRGAESVRKTMKACQEFGVEALTLYCLSSENWKRPQEEIEFLMALLCQYLIGERENLVQNNLRLKIIGRQDKLPAEVLQEIQTSIDACSNNTGMTLCLAINYGSRAEIIDACKALAAKVQSGELSLDEVDEQHLDAELYTTGMPDPDLLIRTSGEMRISNFLLWQISYSELWVTETHWPEFDRRLLAEAIRDYSRRERRFGGIKEARG